MPRVMLAMQRTSRISACLLLATLVLVAMPREAVALCAQFDHQQFAEWNAVVFRGRAVAAERMNGDGFDRRVTLHVYEVLKGNPPHTIQMVFNFDWECGYPPPRPDREYLIYASGYDNISYAAEQPSFTTERQLGFLVGILGLLITACILRLRVGRRSLE